MFSYEFCEISKNTFLTEDVLATASIFNGYFIYTFTFTTFIWHFTAQKMKLFIMDLFGKCEQICRKPGIRSYLLKKSLLENVIFLWSVYLFIFSPNVFWKMYFWKELHATCNFSNIRLHPWCFVGRFPTFYKHIFLFWNISGWMVVINRFAKITWEFTKW